ncbi:MAG: HYR domain-containing protein [Myxococcales bacterium]|nr:HYR domain-containing protein [Myxococcales bacterium]
MASSTSPLEVEATAVDLVDGAPRITQSAPRGSVLAAGVTTVRATATDASGNQASCEFEVMVPTTPEVPMMPEVPPTPEVPTTPGAGCGCNGGVDVALVALALWCRRRRR